MKADYFDAGLDVLKDELKKVITPLQQARGLPPEGQPPPTRPPHAARRIQAAAGAITAALSAPVQLLNDGFALATAPLAALCPALPAAFFGSMYYAPPHGHTHPPSLIPPAPPVPLPSIGSVLIGTSVKVRICGLPAARAGDIGMAVTCCGLVPAFEIKFGSSKVFIGGARAARMTDFCLECAPGKPSMNGLAIASFALGAIATGAGIVADAQEGADAVADGDDALAGAKALDAEMSAKALAMDIAAMAIKSMLGKDIAVPPTEGILLTGAPTVLIGGFPMPPMPDPMQKLFEKLKKMLAKPAPSKAKDAEQGCTNCPP